MTPIAPVLSTFLTEHLVGERAVSPATVAAYSDAYRLLCGFAADRLRVRPFELTFEQLDATLVLEFLSYLENARKCSARTRNARLAAIRTLVAFAADRHPSLLEVCRRIHAIPVKKADSRLIVALSPLELKAILDVPDPRSREGLRDRAMLLLAVNAGMRASELVNLPVQSLDLTGSPSVRIVGKGRKERILPLWSETVEALRAWLNVRRATRAPTLFVNARGGALSRWGFSYTLEKYLHIAAERCPSLSKKHVSPHVLRHTCAMLLLHATHDLRKVALWLGHASIQTTEMYTQADPSEKIETVRAFVPPSLRRGRFTPPDRLMALLQAPKAAQDYVERNPPS